MSLPELSGRELVAWLDRTTSGWKDLLTKYPAALTLPCDIRETRTTGELFQHIVAVELRYAERLCGLAETAYTDIAFDTADSLTATHDRAIRLLLSLEPNDEEWWQASIEFATRSAGTMRSPRRVVFFHLLMHSIRHYAQLATIVRQHGIAPGWTMDYLEMRPR